MYSYNLAYLGTEFAFYAQDNCHGFKSLCIRNYYANVTRVFEATVRVQFRFSQETRVVCARQREWLG